MCHQKSPLRMHPPVDLEQTYLTPIQCSDHSLFFYCTLRRVQKGILKASHHAILMQQHVQRGKSSSGLRANITKFQRRFNSDGNDPTSTGILV